MVSEHLLLLDVSVLSLCRAGIYVFQESLVLQLLLVLPHHHLPLLLSHRILPLLLPLPRTLSYLPVAVVLLQLQECILPHLRVLFLLNQLARRIPLFVLLSRGIESLAKARLTIVCGLRSIRAFHLILLYLFHSLRKFGRMFSHVVFENSLGWLLHFE